MCKEKHSDHESLTLVEPKTFCFAVWSPYPIGLTRLEKEMSSLLSDSNSVQSIEKTATKGVLIGSQNPRCPTSVCFDGIWEYCAFFSMHRWFSLLLQSCTVCLSLLLLHLIHKMTTGDWGTRQHTSSPESAGNWANCDPSFTSILSWKTIQQS